MTGAASMATSEGPEHPGQVTPTTTPSSPKSLWEQPSFLVTFALCGLWLTPLLSSSASAPAARPGAVALLILTVLVYAAYRKKRGWKALPTSGWLPRRNASRRRWIGLGVYLGVLILVVVGTATNQTASSSAATPGGGSQGSADAPWTKSLATTTCGDWLSVMTDRQRQAFAASLLAYDLSRPHGPALDQANGAQYVSMITDTCRNDSPSSLVVQ